MTNGEKMKSVFGLDRNVLETLNYSYLVPIDWWNTEYKEPTTQERQAESDKFDAAYQDGYNCGYAQARFDYEQDQTTKNNLKVDCVDRREVINQIFYSTDNSGDVVLGSALRKRIEKLPSITPQLSSELEKNSKKLEKDFGELDCISRQAVLDIAKASKSNWIDNSILFKRVNELPSVTPQEPIEKCTWIKYDYRTVCPKEHDIDNPYWRIPENMMETLKYCPYCGKEIEVEK